jgi:hypothetical protein
MLAPADLNAPSGMKGVSAANHSYRDLTSLLVRSDSGRRQGVGLGVLLRNAHPSHVQAACPVPQGLGSRRGEPARLGLLLYGLSRCWLAGVESFCNRDGLRYALLSRVILNRYV